MPVTKTIKNLFYLSCAIAVYFVLLVLNTNWLHYISTPLGVIQEMLTLPLLLIQLIIFIYFFSALAKARFKQKGYSFWTFLISFSNCILAIFSILNANRT